MTTSAPEIIKKNCPGCNHPLEIEVERTPYKMHIEKPEDPQMAVSELDAHIEKVLENRKPKEDLKDREKKEGPATIKAPAHIKKGKCKSCGKLHDNELYEGPAKGQCDNCGAFSTNTTSGKCPYCKPGEIGALEDEDIAQMDLYSSTDEEDDHDHE